jgi:TfoX/Sxy family transcriptional regulator of competence genes
MKAKKKVRTAKSGRPKMPKWFPVDEEMRAFSAMLEKEVMDWPDVSKRPMFGYQGLYRDGVIFAALPRSRAMRSPRSILFKLASLSPAILESAKRDSRVDTLSGEPGPGWFMFEMDGASATKSALGWLERAYEVAKKQRASTPVRQFSSPQETVRSSAET